MLTIGRLQIVDEKLKRSGGEPFSLDYRNQVLNCSEGPPILPEIELRSLKAKIVLCCSASPLPGKTGRAAQNQAPAARKDPGL